MCFDWDQMREIPRHERRWTSDTVSSSKDATNESSPAVTDSGSNFVSEEFVEVILDLQDDDTIILRSVEPATVINIDVPDSMETPSSVTSTSETRSPTMRRSTSNKFRQFSQELKAEAVAKARQFSQELKAELRRFSWSHGHASRAFSPASFFQNGNGNGNGVDSALAARALRRQRAQLDRTRSSAQKALRGLKFISNNKTNGWSEVENNFAKLTKDGYLHRSDFAQCIGQYYSKFICSNVKTLFYRNTR